MDELIDIYNEDNEPLDVRKMKSEAHREGLWHRASHVWIYNKRGEILLQLRAKSKELNPLKWDVSAAGHISLGEKSIAAALRETKEELGLSIEANSLTFLKIAKEAGVYGSIINKEFQYLYLLEFNGNEKDLVLQEEEVQEIRFVHMERIEKEINALPEKYVPHGKCWVEIIKEVGRRLKN